MRFEFDTDDVKGWIVDCAEIVWDYYEADPDEFDIADAVWSSADEYILSAEDCLAVIAYYDMETRCFAGDVVFDSCPYERFVSDVYDELPFMFKRHGKRFENGVITDLEEE